MASCLISAVVKQFECLQNQEKHVFRQFISTAAMAKQSNKVNHFSSWRNVVKKLAPKTSQIQQQQQSVKVQEREESDQQLVPVGGPPVADNDFQKKLSSIREGGLRMMEKFIPLTRHQLVNGLSKETTYFSPSEIVLMKKLSVSLDAYISRHFYVQLEEMKFLYDSMDPDKDTIQTRKMTAKELFDDEYWFLQKLETLLSKANYYKIQRSDVLELLQSHDVSEGVRVSVDPLKYSTLRIWTRGLSSGNSSVVQRLKHFARSIVSKNKEPPSFDYYTRVLIAVRSKSSKKLHLKVFKDVPCNELEYLVPDGKIEMSNFDKGFLMSSVFLGTMAICAKLFTIAASLKLDFGLIGLGVAGIVGAKGWVGYKNKRNKYLLNLSRTLYFKTVANNRGVLTLLTDRAEDEEFKESLLAYMFLLSPPNRRGVPGTAYTPDSPKYHSKETLKVQVEDWLRDSFGLNKISFDVDDAIFKLDQMGLLVRHADGTFAVVPIDVALETLPKESLYRLDALNTIKPDLETVEGSVKDDEDMKHYSGWQ